MLPADLSLQVWTWYGPVFPPDFKKLQTYIKTAYVAIKVLFLFVRVYNNKLCVAMSL
jgi:hypothetical protein